MSENGSPSTPSRDDISPPSEELLRSLLSYAAHFYSIPHLHHQPGQLPLRGFKPDAEGEASSSGVATKEGRKKGKAAVIADSDADSHSDNQTNDPASNALPRPTAKRTPTVPTTLLPLSQRLLSLPGPLLGFYDHLDQQPEVTYGQKKMEKMQMARRWEEQQGEKRRRREEKVAGTAEGKKRKRRKMQIEDEEARQDLDSDKDPSSPRATPLRSLRELRNPPSSPSPPTLNPTPIPRLRHKPPQTLDQIQPTYHHHALDMTNALDGRALMMLALGMQEKIRRGLSEGGYAVREGGGEEEEGEGEEGSEALIDGGEGGDRGVGGQDEEDEEESDEEEEDD